MDSSEFKDTVCRICLDEAVVLDWSNTLEEDEEVTYKDCYYKYTQLKCEDPDPFSYMLCQSCVNALNGTHALILKALDSYNFLMEVNCFDSKVDDDSIKFEEEQENEFETVIVEKLDKTTNLQDQSKMEVPTDSSFIIEIYNQEKERFVTESDLDDYFEFENPDEDHMNMDYDSSINIEICSEADDERLNGLKHVSPSENSSNNNLNGRKLSKEKSRNTTSSQSDDRSENDDYEMDNLELVSKNDRLQVKSQGEALESQKDKTEKNSRKRKRNKYSHKEAKTTHMCSYCPRILSSIYALQKHEETHVENRKREDPCPVCGTKFYTKATLKNHMRIHDEKREKKHKCEYCGKGFYEKGPLNIHLRLHLGQMKPCTLCSKEYYRQIDLDRHMLSHSEARISSNVKKRTRYFFRCTECDKEIRTTNYKSHMAAHFKEPLMKCLICCKGFYLRDSCVQHVREIHKKSKEEYNDFIEVFDKGRLSHLLLKQLAEVKPGCEEE